uniref:Putative dicer-2 n=1 Tax=Cupiennius salei TaxID=6928 RepID=A0A061QLI9_CUPSA
MASNNQNPSKKQCTEDANSQKVESSLTPRSYQIEILETARKQNTIACLGTGTGKTFIAVLLIQDCANEVRLPFDEGGKRIFFLVPTVPLVHQQTKTIEDHTDLKVKGFSGDMNVDSWNKVKWEEEFRMNEVLVMTAEIFRIIVDHVFIPLNMIKLIIFDECHRAQGDHPYCQAMKCLTNMDQANMPKIFGLSASLINGKCKPFQLEKQLKELEMTLRSSITTTSDIVDIQRYGADPNEYLVCFKPYDIETELLDKLTSVKNNIKYSQAKLGKESIIDSDLEFFDKPLRCLNSVEVTLRTLGPWCAVKAAEIFIEEIDVVLKKHALLKPDERLVLCQVTSFLEYFKTECVKLDFCHNVSDVKNWPNKLQRLLEIFLAIRKSKNFFKETVPVNDVNFNDDPVKYHQMLKNHEYGDNSNIQICSIVFVEQRITAYVLHKWVLEIKKFFPELNFLNPEYIVGHGNTGVKKTSMSEKRQKVVLSDFRKKKCNVLISTCVLEEGMDVQQCNIVIRFDLPFDFRAYVQSKGRARAKNSIYVLMSEIGEKHVKFFVDMCNFKTVEKMLLDKCHNRSLPSEEEIKQFMADSLIPPYMPYGESGPRITMISAISLINRYCASLPADMATKLTAKWSIREIDPENPVKEFECTLKMPINSPLRVPIVGQKMRQKKLAKMAAALKACQLLDEIGELNEHLVPVSSLLQKTIEEEIGPEEEEDGNGAIPGTKKRRQIYDKHVPVFFKKSYPNALLPCYLHVLKLKLVEPLPKALNPRNRPITDPADTPRGLGILLSKELPKVNPFPIFTKMGKVEVTISLCEKKFCLSQTEMEALEKFHQFIFSDTLHMDESKMFSPRTSEVPCLIVPINLGDQSTWIIDLNFTKSVQDHSYHVLKKSKTFKPTKYNENDLKDAVVMKAYKTKEFSSKFRSLNHVTAVTNVTPNDACNFAQCLTFKDYYKQKYGIIIKDEQQHLIETFKNDAIHNWKPLYVSIKEVYEDSPVLSKSKQKHKGYKELLVPELCIIHPFPSPFLFKVQFLPTILFRLHSLLLAEELRQEVARSELVGIPDLPKSFKWPYFSLETSDKDLRKHLSELNQKTLIPGNIFLPQDIEKSDDNKILTFTREVDLVNHPGPNPCVLLQALTAKSAGDEFDLERLEMIGDSFLKYVVSVKTYIKYPNFDEGKLTKVRSKLIQNLHLYQQAKKKKLSEYLICTAFSCSSTWLPPCYTVNEESEVKKYFNKKSNSKEGSDSVHHFFTKQIVSDKCVADAMEALIGAYLLCCGQKGALMFMSWLSLNPLPDKKDSEVTREDFLKWPPEPPSAIVGQVSNVQDHLRRLSDGLERFEKKINYKFNDKALLLQAFTHPSYFYNEITDCFQRLEFLGDAVLDFLITRQLYEDPNDHSPGRLTDLRSALVNNIYFAYVAVKYEYNKYIKMLSSHLFGLMNYFIDELKKSEAFKFFEKHGYYLEEIECFELDEVEVPKALGDIFESVAGAIYLDSGMSLDTVWKVYYPMIAPAMHHLSEHVPVSPVRQLYEVLSTKDVFKEYEQKGDRSYVKVILPNGKVIVGTGPNKKVCKRSAAKRALAELRKDKEKEVLLITSLGI